MKGVNKALVMGHVLGSATVLTVKHVAAVPSARTSDA